VGEAPEQRSLGAVAASGAFFPLAADACEDDVLII